MGIRQCLVVGAGRPGWRPPAAVLWGVRVRVLDAAPGPFAGRGARGCSPDAGAARRARGGRPLIPRAGSGCRPALLPGRLARRPGSATGRRAQRGSPYAAPAGGAAWRVEQTLLDLLAESCVEFAGVRVVGPSTGHGVVVASGRRDPGRRELVIAATAGPADPPRLLVSRSSGRPTRRSGDGRRRGAGRAATRPLSHVHRVTVGRSRSAAAGDDTFQLQTGLAPGDPASPHCRWFHPSWMKRSGPAGAAAAGLDVRAGGSTWRMVDRYPRRPRVPGRDAAHVPRLPCQGHRTPGIQDASTCLEAGARASGAEPACFDSYEAERCRGRRCSCCPAG